MRLRPYALLIGVVLTTATSVASATTIEREFRYDASRVRVTTREGYTAVDAAGSVREFRAGRPDLPWVSERVEIAPGAKVTGVELLDVQTEAIASGARLASAIVPTPGLGAKERSKPDAQWFASARPQPEELVALGSQGSLRGHQVAYLRVAPARWNPQSGVIERVRSVRVRLTIEDGAAEPALPRERIVREWEDDGPASGVPARSLATTITSATPTSGRTAAPFRPQQLPSVLGSPVAYVIVTSDALAPTFQQLADWKTQSGVPAVVRTLSFLQTQYPSAADDAERIRLFLRDAYTRWGTKWVLLGGDTDIVPARQAFCDFYLPGGEYIASDLYYSCLDGNWNADGDSIYGEGYLDSSHPGDNVDLLPEVYVGRAPVLTVSDAQTFVNKTMQYERTPVGGYENRWVFFSEVLFPQPWTPGDIPQLDGADLTEDILPLTDQNPALHVARLYENYTNPTVRPGALQETRKAVIDSLNAGYGLALHIGHGYRNVMEVGDGSLVNADATSLTNGNKLFNLYAIDCTSNAIDFPCIGEAFILNPNGGAVTNVGSTRFDFPSAGRSYQYEYFRLFFEDSVSAVGELQARQKLPFIAFSTYDGVNRWTQLTLLMLGDPELRMYNAGWRTLSVTAPPSVALSDTTFNVHVQIGATPLYGARVTAYRPGDDYRSVVTDGAGNAVVAFRPDSLGTLTLTVTAYNCKPFQVVIPITAASAPVLVEGSVTIDDDNLGGTAGDGNGSLDAGETADLLIPVRNRGGSTATGVTATLTTTAPSVVITNPTVSYGTIAPGVTGSGAAGFRISTPSTLADQTEIPFTLTVFDAAGHSYREPFQLTLHGVELRSYNHGETETTGNGNGRPEVNEVVNYTIQLRNNGTAIAHGVTLKLRSLDGLSQVTDSTASFGDIAPLAIATGDAITFKPLNAAAKLTLVISDSYGVRTTQTLDLSYPATPSALLGIGAASSIGLTWLHNREADLFGYNIYRGTAAAGPFTKVNVIPTDREGYFQDENLASLTRYYYRVTAVDSSGNESAQSAVGNASTNPPRHSIFPVPTNHNTPSSVALEYLYTAQQMDIVVGSDVLYVLHADGTAPVDADGQGATLGDFTNRGAYYAAGPSIATLDPAQGWSVIGASWDSAGVWVFDRAGNVRPGWPILTPSPIWSSVACGDLDGDGKLELVFATNGPEFYVMRSDGTEWMDGDANPTTKGVFKVLGSYYNYGTPALADLDGDGKPEIIHGGFDGKLNVWKANGSNLPGFPFQATLGGVPVNITGSAAVGYLDGPGDTTPEIVIPATNDSLYVFEPNGQRRAGWPVWIKTQGSSKTPSPAIADMNGDGFNDVVFQSTNGGVYCYDRTGNVIPNRYGLRYSTLTNGASESSPVVADINGDGSPDILCGDETGQLTAFSGLNGTILPGFPIQLQGEIRGAPAVADIDRDGMTEIVVAGWDKNIYVWDYDFPFSPNGPAPWPQFHHDARRTGSATAPLFVGVDDGTSDAGHSISALEFSMPSPNPAVGKSRMWFAVPSTLGGSSYELSIYDLNGRRVRMVQSGIARPGRFSLEWDLRDESRRAVNGGVYFARLTVGGRSVSRKLVVVQ